MTVDISTTRLRGLLQRRRLSIRRAAALAQVPESTVRRLVRAEVARCQLELAERLAVALGVSGRWLRGTR